MLASLFVKELSLHSNVDKKWGLDDKVKVARGDVEDREKATAGSAVEELALDKT